MLDQSDPSRAYMLVVFESQEKARERESDERRKDGLAEVRALMGEIFDGAPAFVDMNVVEEWAP